MEECPNEYKNANKRNDIFLIDLKRHTEKITNH